MSDTPKTGLVVKVCCAGYGIHSEHCPRVLLAARERDLRVMYEIAHAAWHMLDDQEESKQNKRLARAFDKAGIEDIHDWRDAEESRRTLLSRLKEGKG